jgi:hypothetical protein
MRKQANALFLLSMGILVLLTSCTVYSPKDFKHDPSEKIRTIAILTMKDPPAYQLNFSKKFKRQVIIGGVNVSAIKGIREDINKTTTFNKFNDQLRAQHFSIAESMTYQMTKQLAASGYTVITTYVERPGGLLSEYTKIRSAGADAFLDVAPLQVGYSEQVSGWIPFVGVKVRLVSTKSRTVLYDDKIVFFHRQENQSLWPNAKYRFNDTGLMLNNMPLAVEGFNSGSQAIAEHLVSLLK